MRDISTGDRRLKRKILQLKQWMGHADIDTTMKHHHFRTASRRRRACRRFVLAPAEVASCSL
jgi:hypothetical protein